MFFSKGLKIKHRDKDVDLFVKKISQPEEVWIPLIQHIGQSCVPLVKKGDKVYKGQKIGESENFISSYVHSSVSGIVKDIKKVSHPVLNSKVNAVIIINDKKYVSSAYAKSDVSSNIKNITSEKIIESVRNAGISGMGGAAFPTHVKLSVPKDKKVEYFILNSAECEPLLKADAALINLYPEFVLKGMKLAMKAAGIKKGYIGIEKKNIHLADKFKGCLNNLDKWLFESQIEIVMLPDRYPQGFEKQLVDTVLKRKIPPGCLPYDAGVLVNNVATCFAVYEAVIKNKPLYERVVTVTGQAVSYPGNYIISVGTRIRDIMKFCGVTEPVEKIIVGGPMMGIAQYDLDVPVIKGTGGIIFFKKDETRLRKETACIKCGRCVNVCPMNLVPAKIAALVKHKEWDKLNRFNIIDCAECGCCSYVCPSNISIVQLMKIGKEMIK